MVKKKSWLYKFLRSKYYLIRGIKKKRIPFYFEVHITDSCNLNCAGCDHFSPLAKENAVYPFEKYKNDIMQMHKLFGDNIDHVHIMGGEPLTNVRVIDYLRVTRKILPSTRLELITNGLLLKKMPEEFYECCKENDINICITTYPINIDYDDLFAYVAEKGVDVEVFNVRNTDDSWKNMGLSREALLDYKKTFLECKYSDNDTCLNDGMLYICPHAAYIDLFNEYFNECFENKGSGISIHDHDKDEILEFLRTPNSFCRYCHINDKNNKRIGWSKTEWKKEEWLFK